MKALRLFLKLLAFFGLGLAFFVAYIFIVARYFPLRTPPSGGLEKSGAPGPVTAEERQNEILGELEKSVAALRPARDGDLDYFLKRASDLVTSPFLLIVLIGAWVFRNEVFRNEVVGMLAGLRALKVGPVEVGLTSIETIKVEMSEWKLNLPAAIAGASEPLVSDLADLETYPLRKIERTLDEPFFNLDWNEVIPLLRMQEARLTNLEDRLRSLPYFESEKPPDHYVEAKSKLFTLYVRIGNLYGFARSQNPSGGRPVDLKMSEFYLKKAIKLKPEIGGEKEITLGYANFCLAAVNGLVGMELLGGTPSQQADGRSLVSQALRALKNAQDNDYSPAVLFHLKGYLLFCMDDFVESEKSWREAAIQSRSPKMYFNWACVLSKLGRYAEALTQLEQAIRIWDDLNPGRPSDPFDPRIQAQNSRDGTEFEPFWLASPNPAAAAARSNKGHSFQQIVA